MVVLATRTQTAAALEVYPNPATDQLQLKSAHHLKNSQYRTQDARGRQVASASADPSSVDGLALKPGAYTPLLTGDGQRQFSRRFSK